MEFLSGKTDSGILKSKTILPKAILFSVAFGIFWPHGSGFQRPDLVQNISDYQPVFRIRFILMRIRIQIRGPASGLMDPGPELDPDPT